MQYAYVLNKRGEPLMPCSPGKARILLKQQKACVVKRTPFTIKLLHGSAGYKQPITLGVDAGSKHVGLSASTEKRELYSEEFTPRNDVVELLSTRKDKESASVQDAIAKLVTVRQDSITVYTANIRVGLRLLWK